MLTTRALVGLIKRKNEFEKPKTRWRFITNNKEFNSNEGNNLFTWAVSRYEIVYNRDDYCAYARAAGFKLSIRQCTKRFRGLCEIKNF